LGFTYGGLADGLVLLPSRLKILNLTYVTDYSLKGDEHFGKKWDEHAKIFGIECTSALFLLKVEEVHTSAQTSNQTRIWID